MTCNPLAARYKAVASPMPEETPVIRTFLDDFVGNRQSLSGIPQQFNCSHTLVFPDFIKYTIVIKDVCLTPNNDTKKAQFF